MRKPHSGLSFRPDLEGLRGVAILLVVAYHVGVPGVGGGYIGVDVFFVLSGYLITGLLQKELETTGRINLWEFYARRTRRLLPAASLVLIATLAAAWWIYPPFQQLRFTGTALATASYMSNLWFAKESTEYLAPNASANPFLHTWSLSVEEQFYLIWPTLMAITAFLALKTRATRSRMLVLCVLVIGAASFALESRLTAIAQPWAFFGSATRAWEFAVGGLGALLTRRLSSTPSALARAISWAGIAAVVGAAAVFDRTTPFPGTAALLPALGTAAVLTFQGPSLPTQLTGLLSSTTMRFFGRVSYSWYLWHWPVLTLLEAATGRHTLMLSIGGAGIALLLAWLTFVWWEQPLRSSTWLSERAGVSLGLAACLTLVSITTSWSVRTAARLAATRPDQSLFTDASSEIPRIYAQGCHLGFLDIAQAPCAFGNARADTTVVLFGDSHAAQWFPVLDRIAAHNDWKLFSWTKSACPAASVELFETALGRPYRECDTWRETALQRILAMRPGAVVMSSASLYVSSDGAQGTVTPMEWLKGTTRTLSRLSDAGIPTLLVQDTPRPGFDVPACLARAAWNPVLFADSCSFGRAGSRNSSAVDAERVAAAHFRNVQVVDVAGQLCGAETCLPTKGSLVLYRDEHHLTTRFASTLTPLIEASLSKLVTEPHGEATRPTNN